MNTGVDMALPDVGFADPDGAKEWALGRVAMKKDYIIGANPCTDSDAIDEALRAACTFMLSSLHRRHSFTAVD